VSSVKTRPKRRGGERDKGRTWLHSLLLTGLVCLAADMPRPARQYDWDCASILSYSDLCIPSRPVLPETCSILSHAPSS
jgi:hypothetical protein